MTLQSFVQEKKKPKKWVYRFFCFVILTFGLLFDENVNGVQAAAKVEAYQGADVQSMRIPSAEDDGGEVTEEPSYYAEISTPYTDRYDDYNLTISWYSSGNNTGFDIFRKAGFQSDYEWLGSVENEQYTLLEFTDPEFRRGFKYSYRVVAYQELEDGESVELKRADVSWKLNIEQVEMKSVKRSKKVHAKVAWEKSPGVDGYEVFKKTTGGEYKRVKKITSEDILKCTLDNISQKKNTYYKVRAYVCENGTYAYGKFSTQVKLTKSFISKLAAKFQKLQKLYPDGKYWNHVGKTKFDSTTITDKPCYHSYYDGFADTCNYYHCPDGILGYQCYGFAWKMSDLIYGKKAKIKNFYSFSKCKAGDVIRYSGHSVIVVSKKKDYVTVGECNYGDTCIIKWGRRVYKSELAGAKYSRRYT